MSTPLKLVVLGMMGRVPFAGQTWLYVNWLRGLRALGHEQVDLLGFSLGGGVAQVITLEHPELVRRVILAGTGPAGAGGLEKMNRIAGAAYLKAALTQAAGSFPPGAAVPPCRIISLGHVLDFLQRYVRKHWSMLRHLQFKDPAFGFLLTLEQARRGGAGARTTRTTWRAPRGGRPRGG